MGCEATRNPLGSVVIFVPGTFQIAGVSELFNRRATDSLENIKIALGGEMSIFAQKIIRTQKIFT
jgi:hypothetical protein